MEIKNFQDLIVWQKAHQLFIKLKDCGLISKEIFEERYNTCEEIRKMLNALIGSSRRRSKKNLVSRES